MSDYRQAPIPELHQTALGWVERFCHASWEFSEQDVQALRADGLRDRGIVDWAQVASLQTWLVVTADGGGVTLDSEQEAGQAIGRTRESYHSLEDGLLGAAVGSAPAARSAAANGVAWVDIDEEAPAYREAAAWAEQRYGLAPNLLKAVSLRPGNYALHRYGLELLERPQSRALSPRRHAMVRALVSSLNRSAYSAPTTRRLLLDVSGDPALVDAVSGDYTTHDWEPVDRLVLDFAAKALRNSYKIVATDAEAFRAAGLGDEGYIDVLNTVSIQTSQDRLANVLGVMPDAQPVLPLSDAVAVPAAGGA